MPDDIMHLLSSVYTYDVSKNLTDFTKKIDEESQFTSYGTHRHSYEIAKDGASAIPTDDIQCYENVDQKADGKSKYTFIGYMTIYKFYAYPRNLRPRVSQVLILPPFRNNGHATQLLETFYRDFVPMWDVIDIAGEVGVCTLPVK
ncbi:unnamed protein product [Trichobilharzia regenti]|nr:unnamed protein product [Trichobilharzia regenti]